ncbi:MAG: nucleotidyltransferase domain-containing protein [Candidatus Aenigmatarchaeota archaeon]
MKIISLQNELNRNIFNKKNVMKEPVRKILLNISSFVIEDAGIKEDMIKDIILTGSNAGYNYDKFSDIDLHILYDSSLFDDEEKKELFKKYLNEKRRILNLKYNFKIKDHRVEVYFQDINEKHYSQGIYSIIKNKWIKYPEKINVDFNKKEFVKKTKIILNDINQILKKFPYSYDQWQSMIERILDMRRSSLSSEGNIFSTENLIFKFLRRTEILKTIIDYLNLIKSKEYTIERRLHA